LIKTFQSHAFSARRFYYQKILMRLLLGWLFICLLIGGGVLWWEIRRNEQFVYQQALQESAILSGESAQSLEEIDTHSRENLNQLAKELIGKHFLIVEIYDSNKKLKLEVVRRGQETSKSQLDQHKLNFPQPEQYSYELSYLDGRMWVVILLPLLGQDQTKPIGYFKGIYQVDQQAYAAMRNDVRRTVLLVSLGISFTTLLMYPIVLGLIKGIVKLSGELLEGNLELLNVLASAISARDLETNSHNYRVTYYAFRLGDAAGLSSDKLRSLIAGAFLHDVGKIGIADGILLKQDKLTPEEFEIMKTHVALGVEILNKSSWLSDAREVVEFHHEKYDGSGYLRGLKGEQIPISARIFAIVDVFDALTSQRPYKNSWPLDETIASLQKGSGKHFDPFLLAMFTKLAPDMFHELCTLDIKELEIKLHSVISPYFFGSLK